MVGWLVMVNLTAPGGPFANPVLALAAPLALGAMAPSLIKTFRFDPHALAAKA